MNVSPKRAEQDWFSVAPALISAASQKRLEGFGASDDWS